MKLKQGVFAVLLAAVTMAFAASTSSATLTPNPYSTSVGTGSFNVRTPLGDSSCTLTNIRANAVGTTGGANGTVSGFNAACRGVIISARYNKPITLSINRGAVSASVALLITSIFGSCLYQGSASGTMANGGNSATVSGSIPLFARLSGICSDPAQLLGLTAVFPGATVSW